MSLLGSSMAPVALAFAVLDASGSASDLGVVLVARMVPLLGFLLIGGATADRFSRRTVLVIANLGSALTQGSVAALLLTGHYSLFPVAALELLNGVLTAFTTPALRGVVPELVDNSQLQQANSLLSSARNITKILGPSSSGVLVALIGSGPSIAFDAATYLVAAGCLARLPHTTSVMASRSVSVLTDIRDGWNIFRGTPWIWAVTLPFCLVNLVQTGTWQILGPELTKQLSNEATWGLVLGARGLGLLVMGAIMYRLTVKHLLRFGLLLSALGALPFLALGAHQQAVWLIVAAFIAGLGISALGISWDTSLQEHVPAHALSRVSSLDNLLSYLSIPIGQLSVGPLAQAFGGFQVITIAGISYVAAVLIPLTSVAVRQLPHRGAEPAGQDIKAGHAAAKP